MKLQPHLLAALVVVVTFLWWQGRQTGAEVERLRAERDQARAESQALARAARAADSGSREPADLEREGPPAADDPAQVSARIAGLERDMAEVAASLNTVIEHINRSAAEVQRAREPAWSAGQVVGEPDTMTAGDQRTAWAPAAADGGTEWLQLGYEKAVEISQVRVRETCGAGCIAKVAAILDNGAEVIIWQGRHSAGEGIVDAPFNAPAGLTARNVKVYLDTARVPGWNEIDAVELIGRDGTRQWAKTSAASSSYGSLSGVTTFDELTLSERVLTR